jgi:hypothetical protein
VSSFQGENFQVHKQLPWAKGVVLFSCAMFPFSMRADVFTYSQNGGEFTVMGGTESGMFLRQGDSGMATLRSDKGVPVHSIDTAIEIRTGPLISSTSTSWIFNGGTFHRDPSIALDRIDSPPPGYTTCEEAGYFTAATWCLLPYSMGDINATILGPVTLSFDNHAFELSGSLSFSLDEGLAHLLDASAGPYAGVFALDGVVVEPVDGDRVDFLGGSEGSSYPIELYSVEVTATVPEISSIMLLLTAVGATAPVFRKSLCQRCATRRRP